MKKKKRHLKKASLTNKLTFLYLVYERFFLSSYVGDVSQNTGTEEVLTSNVFISVADGKSQTQSFPEVSHSCNFQFYFPSELSNLYIGCLCLAHPNNSLCSSAPWLTFLDHFTVTGTLWVCYAAPPPHPVLTP